LQLPCGLILQSVSLLLLGLAMIRERKYPPSETSIEHQLENKAAGATASDSVSIV